MKRQGVLLAALAASCALAAVVWLTDLDLFQALPVVRAPSGASLSSSTAAGTGGHAPAGRDTLAVAMAKMGMIAPTPGSWITAERALFADVAARGSYDILVAPVQSDGYALDRISRSLLTAQLTAELRSLGIKAPNPYIVQRALGEGLRTLDSGAIVALANRLGVKRIVALAVSHDRNEMLHIAVTLFDQRSAGSFAPLGVQRLAPVALSEALHPFEAALVAMPHILRAIGVTEPSREASQRPQTPATVPETPAAALATTGTDLAVHAASLQLMAELMPPSAPERARERLFEHALLAALALPDDHPSAGFFRARAWRGLESRVASLRALEKSTRPEAVAYRELLNGNLPELTAAAAKVDDPLARLLLEIDILTLKHAYGVPDPATPDPMVARLLQGYPAWELLVMRRVAEGNAWADADLFAASQVLERDLPVPGMSMIDRLRGLHAIGRAPDGTAVAKGMLDHLQRVRKEDSALRRCLDETVTCARGAYVDLLEGVLLSDLYRGAHKRGVLQGLYDEALEGLRELKPEFDGETALLLAEAEILSHKISHSGTQQQRETEMAAIRTAASAVAWREQGTSRTAHEALGYLGVPSPASWPFLDGYHFDLPVRSYWFVDTGAGTLGRGLTRGEFARRERARIAGAITEISVVAERGQSSTIDAERDEILKERFHGHPQRAAYLAKQGGDRLASLEAARRERPDLWSNYLQLGTHHIYQRGDYAAARTVFMEFPGFKKRDGYDAVTLSNNAYEAGSLFFWRGHLEETRLLYEIAAGLRTGSAASISSQGRLALLDGDFRSTVELALARAQRYNDPYAFRDYIAWLFAFGFKSEAWAAFAQLHDKLPRPQVWLAADVGHRVEQRSWPEVKQWLLSEPYRSSEYNRDRPALRLALMQSSVDRKPAPDLVETMRALEGKPPGQLEPPGGSVLLPHPLGSGSMSVQRSRFRGSERKAFAKAESVESPLVMFADAYVSLRNGEFDVAVEKFDRLASYYPIEGSPLHELDAYALPYFAWAAARSGDRLGLAAFVHDLEPSGRMFDVYLAQAFFAGVKGDHDEAKAHLQRAFDNRPNTEKRPVPTEYQWTEACEWLFLATDRRDYLDMALAWARTHQRIQPMVGWAYAFEAKYAKKESDRVRALALALHLDSNADRIADLPKRMKDEARQSLTRSNPFEPKQKASGAI